MSLKEQIQKVHEIIQTVKHDELKNEWYSLRDSLYGVLDDVREVKDKLSTAEEEIKKLKASADELPLKRREEAMIEEEKPCFPYCMFCYHSKDKARHPLKETVGGGVCGICDNSVRLTYFGWHDSGPSHSSRDYNPFDRM